MYSLCKIIVLIYLVCKLCCYLLWGFYCRISFFRSDKQVTDLTRPATLSALQRAMHVPVLITPLRRVFCLGWKQQRRFLCSSSLLCPEGVNVVNKLCRVPGAGCQNKTTKQHDPSLCDHLFETKRPEPQSWPMAPMGALLRPRGELSLSPVSTAHNEDHCKAKCCWWRYKATQGGHVLCAGLPAALHSHRSSPSEPWRGPSLTQQQQHGAEPCCEAAPAILPVPKPRSPLLLLLSFSAKHNEQPKLYYYAPRADSSQRSSVWRQLAEARPHGNCLLSVLPGSLLKSVGHVLWPNHQGYFSLLFGRCRN